MCGLHFNFYSEQKLLVQTFQEILTKIENNRLFKETLGGCVIKMVNHTVILTKEH